MVKKSVRDAVPTATAHDAPTFPVPFARHRLQALPTLTISQQSFSCQLTLRPLSRTPGAVDPERQKTVKIKQVLVFQKKRRQRIPQAQHIDMIVDS